MLIDFEDRPSRSPYVEKVWRSSSSRGGTFLSMAEGNIELVVSRLPGLVSVILRGPVTRGSLVECPPDGEWLAIRFRLGTHFPRIPTSLLLDHRDLVLPVDNARFWLAGHYWPIPTFENADDLVSNLARAGVVARNHATDAAVEGDVSWMSRRSVQRHFRRVTGMTFSNYQRIERARHAAALLSEGQSILSTVFEAGYFDQAHLTTSLRELVGMTPAAFSRERPQLSFSSKAKLP